MNRTVVASTAAVVLACEGATARTPASTAKAAAEPSLGPRARRNGLSYGEELRCRGDGWELRSRRPEARRESIEARVAEEARHVAARIGAGRAQHGPCPACDRHGGW